MKLSVAMATYNGAAHIRAQLDSISGQTRLPDELVVSDDGSTDRTLDIVRGWAWENPAVAVRVLEGQGPGNYTGNFIRAFEATTGDLVFPCDQDDAWLPQKLARMTEHMERNPGLVLAVHDLEYTDPDLVPTGERKMARTAALGGAMRDLAPGMASALRRDFLMCCLRPPPHLPYDNWFNTCALAIGGKGLVHEALALYRRHPEAVTSRMLINSGARQSWLRTRLSYIREVAARDANGRDLERQRDKTGQTLDWLTAHSDALEGAGISKARIENAVGRAETVMQDLARRQDIRRRSRIARILPIVRLWRGGGYRRFNGYGAALKDLVL